MSDEIFDNDNLMDTTEGLENMIESLVEDVDEKDKKEAKKKAKEKLLVSAGLGKNIITKNLDMVLHESMMPYSEHVILDRALPRVEDGLKPVQRRILFTMHELGITPDKPYKKSARIVGDCLGKYHPHGDSSVYDAMVRMAQPFNLRETLIDGHGNFGSVDGDCAAAMRYTEARMAPLALEMLRDLDKNTVPWALNFDDSLQEPQMLPARFPNLLVNGASGIAVGLATNIPPHNMVEAINGAIAYIDNPEITLEEMMKHIKSPDFPTGGYVIAGDGLYQAYKTGKGKIYLRAKVHIEAAENDKKNIVITELPYQVNKASLLQKIVELRDDKKELLAGIAEICDESDRNGMRAVIRVKKDFDAEKILQILFKSTNLETSFSINMIAIANGRPMLLGLLDIVGYYVRYQREVIYRRTKFDLDIAKEREHILEGLVIAVNNIDEVVKIIKTSESPAVAKDRLKQRFKLSDKQAQAILDLRLAKLTSLEVHKLEQELAEIKALIVKLTKILGSEKLQYEIVKTELGEIKKKYKDERRSVLISTLEEYVVNKKDNDRPDAEDTIVASTKVGGLKRYNQKYLQRYSNRVVSDDVSVNEFHTDFLKTDTNKTIIAFSSLGNAYKFVAGDIDEAKLKEGGKKLLEMFAGVSPEEYIVKMFELPNPLPNKSLLFFTKFGMIKKSLWGEYSVQKNIYQAVKLREGDELIGVEEDEADTTILFVSRKGMTLNALKDDIPIQGRVSGGVKGMNFVDDDYAVLITQVKGNESVAVLTNKGYAKQVALKDIEPMARYRKGVKIIDLKDKNGNKLKFAEIVKDNYSVCVFDKEKNLVLCANTETFAKENRTGKGKCVAKGKTELVVNTARKYLSFNA